MPTLLPCQFSRYQMTEEEALQGALLTTLQICCIQNQIADIASRKLNLVYNPQNPTDFAQQISWYQGQLEALEFLLSASEAANLQLNQNR